jgi:hypothetical protein
MRSAIDSSVLKQVALAVERTTSGDQSEISPTTRLVEDLALGRFGRLRLAIHLEEIFDLEPADESSNGSPPLPTSPGISAAATSGMSAIPCWPQPPSGGGPGPPVRRAPC